MVQGDRFVCNQCEYKWLQKKSFGEPGICPRCRSTNITNLSKEAREKRRREEEKWRKEEERRRIQHEKYLKAKAKKIEKRKREEAKQLKEKEKELGIKQKEEERQLDIKTRLERIKQNFRDKIVKENPKKLIFLLRSNPTGYIISTTILSVSILFGLSAIIGFSRGIYVDDVETASFAINFILAMIIISFFYYFSFIRLLCNERVKIANANKSDALKLNCPFCNTELNIKSKSLKQELWKECTHCGLDIKIMLENQIAKLHIGIKSEIVRKTAIGIVLVSFLLVFLLFVLPY